MEYTVETIEAKVAEVISAKGILFEDWVRRETMLVDELGMDSLDILDLVVDLENVFGCEIVAEKRIHKIATVGELCDLIGKAKGMNE